MEYIYGVDLGGTTVKLACFSGSSCLRKWEIPTVKEDSGRQILTDIATAILKDMEENKIEKTQTAGIGIGIPGPVSKQGIVNKCINLGWGVFNVCDALEGLTGLPVKAGNDATVAALGECVHGGGKGAENMVFITLGTGVGGGIVIDGNIVAGSSGAAGEVGHMVLNPREDTSCNCGKKGCAEQYCSATGIARLAKQATGKDMTCKEVFDGKDDPALAGVLAQVYDYLAMLIANICNTVNPDTLVIGGGVSKAGQPLLDGITANLHKYIFHAASNVRLSLATLGNDAGVYGAMELIRKEHE